MPVSEEFRKEHAYWVRRRDEWRKKYSAVRGEIRFYREEFNYHNREKTYWLANRTLIILNSLRLHADKLMRERDIISLRLKETAYKYE
jgi:hypothetical protein